ncbi:MAG TPA: shikimate kinase [Vicinamibacteria bacterium]|nr:shikimate kinase [Vicinamibacteria bacterium]
MPEDRSRVVLVGFMGCGKSTVGRLVARRLGWAFEDMDRRIEQHAGRPVAAIFAEEGEQAFRALEREEARALQRESRCVVAAGGGAFTRDDTRALLQDGAVTVWLRVGLETALARLPQDGSRPLAGSRDIMRALLAEREPSYSRADVTVDGGAPPEEVAERVLALVRGRTAEKRTRRR